MRAVVQRCLAASVSVEGQVIGAIDRGLVAFVGAGKGDTEADAIYLAEKMSNLRVFPDDAGRMSLSLVDLGLALLFVSQFTVFGDLRRGRRPGFDDALDPVEAEPLLERVVALARAKGVRVETGRFRADMRVSVENDGPVTLLIDSRKTFLAS